MPGRAGCRTVGGGRGGGGDLGGKVPALPEVKEAPGGGSGGLHWSWLWRDERQGDRRWGGRSEGRMGGGGNRRWGWAGGWTAQVSGLLAWRGGWGPCTRT